MAQTPTLVGTVIPVHILATAMHTPPAEPSSASPGPSPPQPRVEDPPTLPLALGSAPDRGDTQEKVQRETSKSSSSGRDRSSKKSIPDNPTASKAPAPAPMKVPALVMVPPPLDRIRIRHTTNGTMNDGMNKPNVRLIILKRKRLQEGRRMGYKWDEG